MRWVRCSNIACEGSLSVAQQLTHAPEPHGDLMLYDAYEVQRSLMASASRLAGMGAGWLNNPANPLSYSSMSPLVAAGLDVFAHASASRGKPEFGFETATVGKKAVAVDE